MPAIKMENKGVDALTNTELLAILISSGYGDVSANALAQRVLEKVGWSLEQLSHLKYEELVVLMGVGCENAKKIIAALEIGRRRQEEIVERTQITTSRQAAEIMIPKMQNVVNEEFWVMYLNYSNRIVAIKKVSSGGVSSTIVDPKIILKEALLMLASGLILCHNHPSGCVVPSDDDIQVTKKIVAASQMLDIRVLDHLVVSGSRYFSFSNARMM